MPLTPSPAVGRAAELLRYLAEHPSGRFSVSELARDLTIPRATCDTLLLALVAARLVRRDAERRYQLGPACIALGDAARVANPALQAAADEAARLARDLGAFALVSVRDGDEVRVASVFDFGPPLGLRARVGEAIPLVAPFGASFVAWSGPDEVERWLGRAQPPLDRDEVRAYRRALDGVRERGYTVAVVIPRQPDLIDALERLVEDRDPEAARRLRDEAAGQMAHSGHLAGDLDAGGPVRVAQISSPVFDASGDVAASIMLLGPNHELTAEQVTELGRTVGAAASAATRESGGRSPSV